MFNFSGSEIVFLLLLALIILGPEKLPEAIRTFGKTYAEFKKVTTGFQSELKSALDEPMREMRETADLFKNAASFDGVAEMFEDAKKVVNQATDPASAPATAPETVAADPAPTQSAADAAGAAPPLASDAPTASAEADAPVVAPAGPAFHSAAPPIRRPDPQPETQPEPAVEAVEAVAESTPAGAAEPAPDEPAPDEPGQAPA